MELRLQAAWILGQVLGETRSLKNCLAHDVASEDRAWLRELTAGTLRWQRRLDHVIDSLVRLKRPAGLVRKILRLATYQLLLHEHLPSAWIVNESVEAVKRRNKRSSAAPVRFVNATLRQLVPQLQQWRSVWANPPSLSLPPAVWASLPDAYYSQLAMDWGEGWAQDFAHSALERPRLWLRSLDDPFISASAQKGPVPGAWVMPEGGLISAIPGFEAGAFFVQDISSQSVVAEVAGLVGPIKGTVLDLCAAPGGKALGIAALGYRVRATDHSAARCDEMRAYLPKFASRLRGSIEVVNWPQRLEGIQDSGLIWIDAPCSASGNVRRHPELRWTKDFTALEPVRLIQRTLLREGWDLLRPQGFLLYSVCSIRKDEGENHLRDLGLLPAVVGSWLKAPHLPPHGDGFWAVLLRKGAGSL